MCSTKKRLEKGLQLGLAQGVHVVDLGLVLVIRILAADFESRGEAVVLDREWFEADDESLDAFETNHKNTELGF